jgi:hypothetical protein
MQAVPNRRYNAIVLTVPELLPVRADKVIA